MPTTTELIGGLDIGNGYVKGVITNEKGVTDEIDLPSGVALVTRPNSLPTKDAEASATMDAGFCNQLDASFASPMVGDNYRRLFGQRGIAAGGSFEEFDVVGRRSKAEQPLSKVLVLGCFAAKAVEDFVSENGTLPTQMLEVTARAALALPITEFMAHRVSYAAEFTTGSHLVTIHNFETQVAVRITFADVQIVPEGASAQYAIADKGEPLMDALLDDVRSRGVQLDEAITGADVLAATNTVGIDIGEGTVNYPVFTGGKFNPDVSTTFARGYGSVLTSALESMDAQNVAHGLTSRKQLAAYLQTPPSALKRAHYNRVARFVDEETTFFAREVAEHFGRILSVVGAMTEVVYVYGGGAGAAGMKETLYPLLIAKVAEMSGEDASPVLYLDSSYSRNLNREGLYIAAQSAKRLSTK